MRYSSVFIVVLLAALGSAAPEPAKTKCKEDPYDSCEVDADCCNNQCITSEREFGDKKFCRPECLPGGTVCEEDYECCGGDTCISTRETIVKICKKYVAPVCKKLDEPCYDVADCCDAGDRQCEPLPVDGI
ncbi:hypothetical protein VE03_10254, partial [Pseudogymnoascus sp. 23342-1-I1]